MLGSREVHLIRSREGTRCADRTRALAPLVRRPADAGLECHVLLQSRDDLDTERRLLPGDGSNAGDRGLFRSIACLVRGGVLAAVGLLMRKSWAVSWFAASQVAMAVNSVATLLNSEAHRVLGKVRLIGAFAGIALGVQGT